MQTEIQQMPLTKQTKHFHSAGEQTREQDVQRWGFGLPILVDTWAKSSCYLNVFFPFQSLWVQTTGDFLRQFYVYLSVARFMIYSLLYQVFSKLLIIFRIFWIMPDWDYLGHGKDYFILYTWVAYCWREKKKKSICFLNPNIFCQKNTGVYKYVTLLTDDQLKN